MSGDNEYVVRVASCRKVKGYRVVGGRAVFDVDTKEMMEKMMEGRKRKDEGRVVTIPQEIKLIPGYDKEYEMTLLETKLHEQVKAKMMNGRSVWSRHHPTPDPCDLSLDELVVLLDKAGTPVPQAPPRPSTLTPSLSSIPCTDSVTTNFNTLDRTVFNRCRSASGISPSKRVRQMITDSKKHKPAATPARLEFDLLSLLQSPTSVGGQTPPQPRTGPPVVPPIRYPGMPVDENGNPTLEGIQKDHALLRTEELSGRREHTGRFKMTEGEERAEVRKRVRQEVGCALRERVLGMGEVPKLPQPAEVWYGGYEGERPYGGMVDEASSEIHGMILERQMRNERIQLLRSKTGTYKAHPRTTILGIPSISRWQKLNDKLRTAATTFPLHKTIGLRQAADKYRLTPHERKKMPLPLHLAYRTKGGLRNY